MSSLYFLQDVRVIAYEDWGCLMSSFFSLRPDEWNPRYVNVSDSPGKVHVTVTLFPDVVIFTLVSGFNSAAKKNEKNNIKRQINNTIFN